ncbi:PREDICTED: leucine-rich repeat-containing protein 30-like isoform X2 [Trachymyrmex septentrionalis]|uniref:leucine-rich repeat-containing protein 30-like isoform X2 n=1 Tax=Trachymyrmex septentrionalis TaxID=34720 RepID=UPI00084F5C57|nr:PREDICTED: leucine-rich repeat-containing protein 30-like isoform X2 [Trachymyrmex septentrionalis]
MSNNSLFELSEFIWNLTALEELNISHNFLGHLPQGIKKRPVQNLRTLDLSHNLLKYLPIEINRLKLQTINISMNPFFVRDEENWQGAVMFSSLSQLAAKILRLYCRDVTKRRFV